MTDLTPARTSPFEAIKQTTADGEECWSARDLMPLMGYSRWEDFEKITRRALASAGNVGQAEAFSEITEEGTGGRPRSNFTLNRFASYLVAMNGDPNKAEVATAQAYFAVRTREAEVADMVGPVPRMSEKELLARAVVVANDAIKALEAKVEADAPKVEYVDTYVADSDLLSIRTLAANLNVQESWLRELLLNREWIYKETISRWSNKHGKKMDVSRYSAYAHKRNYFEPKPVHDAPRFKGEVMHTLKVTPAGAVAIAKLVRRALAGLSLVESPEVAS